MNIPLDDENEKEWNSFLERQLARAPTDELRQDLLALAEFGKYCFMRACKFKDDIYFYMSATQCVHEESLTVEEGHDGVICRKHLKIQKLEEKNLDLTNKLNILHALYLEQGLKANMAKVTLSGCLLVLDSNMVVSPNKDNHKRIRESFDVLNKGE